MPAAPRVLVSLTLVMCTLTPVAALAEEGPRPPRARAEEPAAPPVRRRMQVHLPIDLSLVLGLSAAWVTTEVMKSTLAPAACRWCDPPGLDARVKASLRWDNPPNASRLSDLTAFALSPAAALGLSGAVVYMSGGTLGEWAEDALLIGQAGIVAASMTQLFKFAAGRERPFVFDLDGSEKGTTKNPADNNLSFFSGHTSFPFALAVSSGTIASLKRYRAAPFIWATGLSLAAASGYLRIAGDKHYFTDVVTGAVVGAAAGFLVPWLHRPMTGESAQVSGVTATPLPGGGALVGLHGALR